MSYREKTAWLSLVAMAVAFGPYFAIVESGLIPKDPLPNLRLLGLFAAAAFVQLLVLGIGNLLLFRQSPLEAKTPMDEREVAMKQRAVSYAYYFLIAGMIIVGCVMPFTASGWTLVNAALMTIVAAELVHYGTVVASYRSQS